MADEPKPDVPWVTVKRIADNYRELTELQLKQAATMAVMIRACLSKLDRKPTGFERSEDLIRNRRDRAEALKGLADLATMLETKASGTLTLSNEG